MGQAALDASFQSFAEAESAYCLAGRRKDFEQRLSSLLCVISVALYAFVVKVFGVVSPLRHREP